MLPIITPGGKCGQVYGVNIPCDWEKIKCKIKGAKLKTACNTVSDADRAGFLNYTKAGWLHEERARDFYEAWGWEAKDQNYAALEAVGITKEDLAIVHLDNIVPTCLSLEAGRHTCNPKEAPGKLFYDAARARLVDDIRNGRMKWSRPARGGSGGQDAPAPRPGQPGGPAGPPSPGDAMGGGPKPRQPGSSQAGFSGSTLAVLALAAFFLLKGRG